MISCYLINFNKKEGMIDSYKLKVHDLGKDYGIIDLCMLKI